MKRQEVMVKASGFTYRVLIENGALGSVGKALRMLFPSGRALLVSDTKVFSLYGEKTLQALAAEKWQVSTVLIRPGERSKNLTGAARIYDAAVSAGLDRNSPVIALGGGVVGDLAGFAASTFLRGVPLVMLPTSLLAQVDSSVGGKVAVNHPRGKNLIGSVYPPRVVIIDPQVLNSLPARQLKAGLAEVLKYGIIINGDFFAWLESNLSDLLISRIEVMAEAVALSVKAKAAVVEADEFEKDYRRVLNFGHTIGHALEAATGYRYYLHGEAVLVGMAAATKIACEMNVLGTGETERIVQLLARIGLKKAPADLTAAEVIDKLRQDKKRLEDDLIFVLPKAIGKAEIIPVKDKALIEKNVRAILK
jgi:3-dehydroquinate synthase